MDFARKQLEKYGWTDGKGLGKHENGISEALKPKLKRSVTGIGHDPASDFTEHWWKTLYDKAANNVQVEEKNGKTKKIKTKDKTNFEITNSTWKLKRKYSEIDNNDQYSGSFVRKSILTNGGAKIKQFLETNSEEEAVDQKDLSKMSDEALFAACEGRTAHKGARHGLKALGKLARIEQQEKKLLMQSKYNGYSHAKHSDNKNWSVNDLQVVEEMNLNSDADMKSSKKKKKKSKCRTTEEAVEKNSGCCATDIIIAEDFSVSVESKSDLKKSKKKKKDK